MAERTRGPDYNPGTSVPNERLAVGVTVIQPGNSHVVHTHTHPETYVIMRGAAAFRQDGETVELHRLDAVYFPPGAPHTIRNAGDEPLYVMWVHADPAKWGKTTRLPVRPSRTPEKRG